MTDTLAAIAADFRNLLTEAERFADDHSPDAIFWRAWRASMVDAPRTRAWKARAINLDPAPLHNAVALSGMVPIMWEERWHLGVALPQPNPAGGFLDHVDDIILLDPKSGKAQIMGDRGATHVSAAPADRVTVVTDPKAWARSVALDRLEWFRLRQSRRAALQVDPTWLGYPPIALLLTTPNKVQWADLRADVIEVPADMRVAVRRAMLAQARLPRVEGRA